MNVNHALTVKQLYEECKRVINNGGGNREILITSDDEGNSYHALWYGINDSTLDIEYALKVTPVDCYDIEDISKIALLG